ncbi:membrane protein [Sphaerisporangium melleum]|uniref:Membrane protein n=1 Tax=Sphaerisporangium melleum TaxID=321316 RepID=A0A917RJQ2_9ACTN|nr:PP2C family protein-serine/threonine phosphatase [Sphaerisporangium melleum]GGL10149.1 membrane protein [Sphaerisporangium melleum]GII70773.1 membrane protein [Sphaerisporangium melleum]
MAAKTDRKSRALLRSLPFAAIAAVACVDLLAGPRLGFLPLLTLGPTFASVSGSVRRTMAIGALALAVSLPLAYVSELLLTPQNNLTIATIIAVTGASALASRLRIHRERELANVRLVAEAAQRVLLRPVPRRADDLHIGLSYTSAAAEAQIGGDLYEVVTTPAGVRLLIGDVQGKGLDAVEIAAWVLGAFREAAYDEPELSAVGQRLENSLVRHLSGEKFVTAIIAEVHDGEISLLNFGHPAPLVIRHDGHAFFAEPQTECPPLGLVSLSPSPARPSRLPFLDGDQILFYTDGVIEARDPFRNFYPLFERTKVLTDEDPQVALDELRTDLLDHVGGPLGDDVAMLLLRRRCDSGPSDDDGGRAAE